MVSYEKIALLAAKMAIFSDVCPSPGCAHEQALSSASPLKLASNMLTFARCLIRPECLGSEFFL